MSRTGELAGARDPQVASRLVGAPISWGVCEVPGWGLQLPPARVLAEMAELGLTASEIGPVGWLPEDPQAVRAALEPHGLRAVGGFVPFVLHERDASAALAEGARVAQLYAAAGAEVISAALVMDAAWSAPTPLDDRGWQRLATHLAQLEEVVAAHGVTLAVHPHVGTLIERAEDVQRLLDATRSPLCFDSGHQLIGGADPAAFVREHAARIAHVHLKDVDMGIAERLTAGELGLMEAVQAGLFRPLGAGDADIAAVAAALEERGYERWLVLEQDTAITGSEPPVGGGPKLDVAKSIGFLTIPAPEQEEVFNR